MMKTKFEPNEILSFKATSPNLVQTIPVSGEPSIQMSLWGPLSFKPQVYVSHACRACEAQERASDALRMELQMVLILSCHVGTRN